MRFQSQLIFFETKSPNTTFQGVNMTLQVWFFKNFRKTTGDRVLGPTLKDGTFYGFIYVLMPIPYTIVFIEIIKKNIKINMTLQVMLDLILPVVRLFKSLSRDILQKFSQFVTTSGLFQSSHDMINFFKILITFFSPNFPLKKCQQTLKYRFFPKINMTLQVFLIFTYKVMFIYT